MSWQYHDITFFYSSFSKPFLMSRHCFFGVATLSFDVLRDVATYVVAMSRHCYSDLSISIDVVARS